MRKLVGALLGTALVLGSSLALAQNKDRFGTRMTAAFSADRLFGFNGGYVREDGVNPCLPNGIGRVDGCPNYKENYTSLGFGWQGPVHFSPYTIPRFAFDFFVIDGLSIGGSLGYASYKLDNPAPDLDVEVSAWVFEPRVGYVWMFSDAAGFWLRGGLTIHGASEDPCSNVTGRCPGSWKENGFALTFDPEFVLSPVPHFGFTVGPVFDWTFAGTRTERADPRFDVDHDIHYLNYGITVGLIGWI